MNSILSTWLLRVRPAIALGIASALAAPVATANGFPSRTVTIVVPFPAGAGPDLVARVLAEKLATRLGQSVIVDNKPGVGGLAGAGFVAKSQADGHTLLLAPNTLTISPHILPKGAGGGLDVTRDLVPIIAPVTTPMMLMVSPRLGVKSVEQLIALAKQKPGLPYASAGNGSPMHFAGELFKRSAGVDMLHVPYKGVTQSVTAVLGGEVQVLYVALGGVLPHLMARTLVPLAVAEKKRSALTPEVPSLAERGVPGVEVNAWYGLFAPVATPPAVVERLNREFNAILKMPDVQARLEGSGMELLGGSEQVLATMMRADDERYSRIAREIGIRAD
ncbi:MAG TPA: tripartite tricarboxylate transporter substrate binding protein [Variovorax sp.]|nr:tripartite tricarboxylate transporter substrate binding protein [Variovorax sp.]